MENGSYIFAIIFVYFFYLLIVFIGKDFFVLILFALIILAVLIVWRGYELYRTIQWPVGVASSVSMHMIDMIQWPI